MVLLIHPAKITFVFLGWITFYIYDYSESDHAPKSACAFDPCNDHYISSWRFRLEKSGKTRESDDCFIFSPIAASFMSFRFRRQSPPLRPVERRTIGAWKNPSENDTLLLLPESFDLHFRPCCSHEGKRGETKLHDDRAFGAVSPITYREAPPVDDFPCVMMPKRS